VREAAFALRDAYVRAEACIATRDTDQPQMISGSSPAGTAPPWNPQAANAALDIHEGARRLEASLHTQITRRPRRRRGGSEANTAAAIRGVGDLGASLPGHVPCLHSPRHTRCCCDACRACQIINRWVNQALLLPAIDEGWRWSPMPGDPPCPYCSCLTLRVAERLYVIACHNSDCKDSDGNTPTARLGPAPHTQQAAVLWNDGLVT